LIRIHGDFNHKDEAGRVRLDTPDAVRDIEMLGNQLREGERVLVHDVGGYEAECVLERVNKGWRARVISGTGRAW